MLGPSHYTRDAVLARVNDMRDALAMLPTDTRVIAADILDGGSRLSILIDEKTAADLGATWEYSSEFDREFGLVLRDGVTYTAVRVRQGPAARDDGTGDAEVTSTYLNRVGWKHGPWNREPDRIAWTDATTGYPCIMRRVPAGAWCGYVGVPEGHPFYGLDETAASVCALRVHGGLTYAAPCTGDPTRGICHVASDAVERWWLGFDCGHNGDLLPSDEDSWQWRGPSPGVYHDVADVRGEVQALARQVHQCATTAVRP